MALTFSKPRIITRGPYTVLGVWAPYEDDDQGPAWIVADSTFRALLPVVLHRADCRILGFLYRPWGDNPAIHPDLRACFVGAEVTSLEGQPAGLTVTHFSGGEYALMDCIGDTPAQAAMGLGVAIHRLTEWMATQGYAQGDACFSAGCESAQKPPWIETVYIKLEPAGQQ